MWNSVFSSLPNNGQTVWIRVLNVYGEPVLATYDSAQQTFTTITTAVILPVYYVARWKAQ